MNRRDSKLQKLVGAALALPGVLTASSANAQNIVPAPVLRLKFGEYQDFQTGDSRMKVYAPMMQFQIPVTESWQVEGSSIWESMSGASPLYLSTLSGASGVGIADHRSAGDLRITKLFERFSVAATGATSGEDDYSSNGFALEGRIWTENKNTVLAIGGGANYDKITSTNDPALNESRRTTTGLIGVTQVLDPISIAQFNFTFSIADGYLSDPYKTFDKRPESRDMFAWLLRYVRYVEETEGSVHVDLNFFKDSYSVLAETLELSYYQPLGESWMIRPSIRYYTQDQAYFFRGGRLPSDEPPGFFSADQRLSDFGEWGAGVKIIKDLTETLSVDLTGQIFHQRAGFHLGSTGARNIEPFTGYFVLVGLTKKF